MAHVADLEITSEDISRLASPDALAGFFTRLGYPTGVRKGLDATALGLAGDTAEAIRGIELLAEDSEGFFRVVFVKLRSLTAKARNDLARNLGRRNVDHLLILASDFDVIEFVLIDKHTRQQAAPGGGARVQIIPRTVSVKRKDASLLDRRTLRRLTWTGKDGLDQFDKLRSVFEAAAYTGQYFQNRALFADHYLETRLHEDAAWQESPADKFIATQTVMRFARTMWTKQSEAKARGELYEPVWGLLGFKHKVNKPADKDQLEPDYILSDRSGRKLTVAFVYRWDRWLDGPDLDDPDTPEENPGAAVVTALARGDARWVIVSNGKLWRLYCRDAHSRSTNFYEVNLEEALRGETDPNEAFRYWWLFFRAQAFAPVAEDKPDTCWLDTVVQGSRDYAKGLGERLKNRIFIDIFPRLAEGFLADRRGRLDRKGQPSEDELKETFEATLTLLYRLLFLLYAESRDLLPVREAPYLDASLKRLKGEVAERAGVAESQVPERLQKAYSDKETKLYDRLTRLFGVMDQGDSLLNVPTYNGGLFLTSPDAASEAREHRIARFLVEHKVPDRFLALAIDRLARDPDDKTCGLVFIDYKSLEVRHLGSIYEGLLEFRLRIADEDLATATEKKKEKYIPLAAAKAGRGRKGAAAAVVRKGEVYLSNDKAERKATGSYYTPDPIVEYIVEHTVGPVLAERLDGLRDEFNKAGKTYHRQLSNARANPAIVPKDIDARAFAAEKTYAEHKDLVEKLFDFKVLDPAMGSGHFLVEAVDFLTDRILDFLNRFPNNPVSHALDRTRNSILEALTQQSVTVDPDKLTDINLLKRHVLKRCIYGVDLNPMAVELAKVSLWLDAFTLGAPLSFLDHHLRCGNSLVGATFEDLRKATSGQLFSIDYEPLLRAIRHVLFVNAMADATAAEVHQSAREYDEARKELSGYQIVFDLLVADHFIEPEAEEPKGKTGKAKSNGNARPSSLLTHAHELDLSSRDTFLASLHDEKERKLVARVEALASQPDRRFFHWEIEFPEVFFGLADSEGRQIRHMNAIQESSAGFDAVVGNPPYDVLAEKELETDLAQVLAYYEANPIYAPAIKGKHNLYKLFVCRNTALVRRRGTVGHIVPMTLLGDQQAVGVRKLMLSRTSLSAVEAFPQKDDPHDRVFEDAKLSTCIFVTMLSDERGRFRCRTHPGKDILDDSPALVLRPDDVKLYDPENQPIVSCSQEDWDLAVKIMSSGRLRRLRDFCTAYQGEVNEKTDGDKGNISDDPKDGPQILRGSNICLYVLREASQGEAIFLRKDKYLRGKKPDAKAWHHQQNRVGVQESCPQNNFRRIIAASIPTGQFCNHKINYFPEKESRLPLEALLAVLNSKLIDWYFRLGSTNASVSHYQLYNLPTPAFSLGGVDADRVRCFRDALDKERQGDGFRMLEPLLSAAPFPETVVICMMEIVQRIFLIEQQRGAIARSDRSALDEKAQPLQDLLDHMIFRMAGLNEDEAMGLVARLARML